MRDRGPGKRQVKPTQELQHFVDITDDGEDSDHEYVPPEREEEEEEEEAGEANSDEGGDEEDEDEDDADKEEEEEEEFDGPGVVIQTANDSVCAMKTRAM